jgi:hypothetical protein
VSPNPDHCEEHVAAVRDPLLVARVAAVDYEESIISTNMGQVLKQSVTLPAPMRPAFRLLRIRFHQSRLIVSCLHERFRCTTKSHLVQEYAAFGSGHVRLLKSHYEMEPSQRWSFPSAGAIIISQLLPRHGDSLPHVARLVDEYLVESLDEQLLAAACELGATPADLDFLLSRTFPDWKKVVTSAVRGGHLHVFRWMTERPGDRGPWEADFDDVMKEAAQYGHVGIIKWLHGQGFGSLTDLNVWEALCNDHLAAATSIRLEGNLLEDYEKQQLRLAALSGHRTTLQWIYMNFLGLSDTMERAATTGDLDMLQWLHKSEGCWEECSVGTMDAAVCGGHLRVVEWLPRELQRGLF